MFEVTPQLYSVAWGASFSPFLFYSIFFCRFMRYVVFPCWCGPLQLWSINCPKYSCCLETPLYSGNIAKNLNSIWHYYNHVCPVRTQGNWKRVVPKMCNVCCICTFNVFFLAVWANCNNCTLNLHPLSKSLSKHLISLSEFLISIACDSSYFPSYFFKDVVLFSFFWHSRYLCFALFPLKQKRHEDVFIVV